MAETVVYVYAVVPADLEAAGAPAGLEGAAVRLIREERIGALASDLPGADYTGEKLSERSGDLEWLAPRAASHDRVATWASDSVPVVPLPMFTLFSAEKAVRGMLAARAAELTGKLDRVRGAREYSVRIFRLDDKLREALPVLSPRLRETSGEAAAGGPGKKYLVERKTEAVVREEAERVSGELATRSFDVLSAVSASAVRDPLPSTPAGNSQGRAIMNAAFLVRDAHKEKFQKALTELVQQWEPNGFAFEFTGPWAPYHFVRDEVAS